LLKVVNDCLLGQPLQEQLGPLDSDISFFLVKSWVVAFNQEGPRWVKKDWVRHRTGQTQIHGVEDHGSVW